MSAFEDKSGKINRNLFGDYLYPYCGHNRPEVITGAQFGVDTAVIDLGNNLGMAVSSDPLSLIPALGLKESAWLSVHLLANDLATTGYAPMYAQFVLNLPDHLSGNAFQEYWKYIHAYCDEIGVSITGGHTGQIPDQNSTIAGGGTMFLTAPLDRILTSNCARPGDKIIVTKESALVSTSILAMSFPETVRNKLGEEIYREACENFYRTSALPEALMAAEVLAPTSGLSAMHDVTEGGILGCIYEMADASGCGFEINSDLIPAGEVQRRITGLFGLDHRYCIGAGSMILAVRQGNDKKLVEYLAGRSVRATVVGELTSQEKGFVIIENGQTKPFEFDGTDPYWDAFFRAMQKGLK